MSDTPPTGWAQDSLTNYLDDLRKNQFATYANKSKVVQDCIAIDVLFRRFLDGAINPKPFAPMAFFFRAHSAFLAASGSTWGGQFAEAQAVLRLCLEYGGYGFFVGEDVARWERWMARNESTKTRNAVRSEFSQGNIKRALSDAAPQIGCRYEILYERLIDLGAHPNERGVSLGLDMKKDGTETKFDTIYLHGNGLPLDFNLRTCVQVGVMVLHVMQLVYATRFQILAINDALAALRTDY